MKDKHTGGKWLISSSTMIVTDEARLIANCTPLPIQELFINMPEAMANADRIAACVNALDGISNEALSSGVVGEMVEAVEVFKEFYDADVAIEWDVFWPKIQSILSKLEANNG